jgi:hypothetical protein
MCQFQAGVQLKKWRLTRLANSHGAEDDLDGTFWSVGHFFGRYFKSYLLKLVVV